MIFRPLTASVFHAAPAGPARLVTLAVAALVALAVTPALAASGGHASEAVFIAQILVLVVVGRLAGEAMQRIGQPAVMGQLLAGIALGPSLFGLLAPHWQHALFPTEPAQKSMIDAVSQVGILLLLLLAGMETDLALVRKVRRAAASVSLTGIAVPFACGFLLGEFLPESMIADPAKRLVTSLFLGTALSISSVKIVAIVVRDMNFMRRDVGQVIVASAIIDDTIGWLIIAVTFGIASTGTLAVWPVLGSLAGAVIFIGVSLTLGRRLVAAAIRLTNDHFVGELPVVSAVLAIMAAMALTTQALGLHTVLGAFVAGVLVGESPILTRQIEEQIRGLTTALFMPVFFGLSGLSADLTALADPALLATSVALIAIASLGKFGGAFVGGKLGGLGPRESLALGCGMNARGSTEVIVASIGLSMGALTETLFTMIVVMAVVTTMAMPPTLRWALARLPLKPEEAERLAREEVEAQGFVSRFERLLVAGGVSPGSRFAARLAGLVAGPRGLPVTTLRLEADEPTEKVTASETAILSGAQESRERAEDGAEGREVAVVARTAAGRPEDEIATEAQRGYDILFLGIAASEIAAGAPAPLVAMAEAFEGPLAIAVSRGDALADPPVGPRRILVAVNGTPMSQRGLETALALARATQSPVEALYVAPQGEPATRRRRFGLGRRKETAVLREAVRHAERLGVPLRARIRRREEPVKAIAREAVRRRHDLIVLGVSRRPGEGLAFGTVADALVADAPVSVLLVAG
jgi:Kef-type K+ transport system membrane component KefB/nucleotide-binding universal stress UspA family protein